MEPTLSYQPLARTYRPSKFSDLIGQEAVTRALSNSIKISREPAGVIFSGVRGIGKTTTARIYAKALNCASRKESEPCCECDSCIAIAGGFHEDVLEIDGASHNGVDEIRALKETVNYVPHRSKYKVYIIDEVHMLSVSAFNALLKTLEEPPPHVVFIFATTELQKVPQTIIGRCQTFHLQKLTIESTLARIKEILIAENLSFEDDALHIVAREGQGSMRDALTFLDQAIALGEGQLTREVLEQITSSVSSGQILTLLSALVERRAEDCIKIISKMDQDGCSFTDVVHELARFSRHAFLIKNLPIESLELKVMGVSDHEIKTLKELSTQAQDFDLNRIFRSFIRCRQDLDSSSLDRFIFENYCLEWCLDPGFPKIEELLQKSKADSKFLTAQSVQGADKINNMSSPLKPHSQGMTRTSPQFLDKLKGSIGHSEKKTPAPAVNIEALGLIKASQIHRERPQKLMFPSTWQQLVEEWKKNKPLEARKFEEVYLREYSREKIVIAVRPEGLAAKDLLNQDQLRIIRNSLKNLFEFHGEFIVTVSEQQTVQNENESILENRTRVQNEQDKLMLQEAKENNWTQGIIKHLNGKLDKVALRDHT